MKAEVFPALLASASFVNSMLPRSDSAAVPFNVHATSPNILTLSDQLGSNTFLLTLQCPSAQATEVVQARNFFSAFSAGDAACSALMRSLESDLTLDQKKHVAETAKSIKLLHKNTIAGMREKLANFPVASNNLTDKENLRFHPAVCSSIVTDTPLVTSFNWKEQLFYGLLLDSHNMVPVLTSHRNLWSDDCAYEVDKWTDRKPTEPGKKPEWNWRPIANAAPNGELCHDMDVAIHMAARDIALKESGHDSLRDKEILTFNEVNVASKANATSPLSKGIFVDFVSNDFVYLLRKPKYESLLKLSQRVSIDRWLKAMQAVNFEFLQRRHEEFAGAKSLCEEHHLPFFIRSINADGVVGFTEIDIQQIEKFADLARLHPILSNHSDWLLKPLVHILKAVIT